MTRLGGWTIEAYDAVTSTNDVARRAVRGGAADHSVYVANEQTAGRGRGSHTWTSPPGGLYCSLLLRTIDGRVAPLLPLVVGEAVRRAVHDVAPETPTWLKWPNDVLAASDGADVPAGKVGGVLSEGASSGDGLDWVVVGVGLNLAPDASSLPSDVDPPAVSLRDLGAPGVDRDAVLDAILSHVNDCLAECGRSAPAFVTRLESRLAYRGERVLVTHSEVGAPGWEGTLVGLAPSGALRLDDGDQERTIEHWHVGRLRPA